MRTPTLGRHLFAAPAAVSMLLLAAACGTDAADPNGSNAATQPADNGDSSGSDASSFAPGEYEASGSYNTPGGVQRVDVEVELAADGTITGLDVNGQATSGNSVQFQGLFESGIEDEVAGKKISELDVSHVSGSSLTSGGFNRAIEEIIAEARTD